MSRAARTALCALALLAAGAPAASAACGPTGLQLDRRNGRTTATLSWRVPAGVPAGARFRVSRDGAVVGQTRRTRARVRVSLGRRHRLTVRVVRPDGRPTRCATTRSFRVAYRMPGAPLHAGAAAAGPGAVRLSWRPARRGDAPVAGYRVLRDGAVLRQTSALGMVVRAASRRPYRFTVVAVDRHGRTGPASAPVTVELDHQAPATPSDLTAVDATDSAVSLRWSAVTPASAPVAGYRVLRDGVPVRQVPGTAFEATGLFAQRAYAFSVQAVDSQGYVSAPSAPVTATTAAPEPSTGLVHAYLLASTDQSFRDFQAHYRQIGTVYPTYYDCGAGTASLDGVDDPLIDRYATARKVVLLPRFNCQRTQEIHRILTEPALRAAWLDGIVDRVDAHGYDGASLDFEAGLAADRHLYTAFVAELADRLHARGKRLTVTVSAKTRDIPNHPRSTFFDYLALAEHADTIFVMAWGIHWSTGPSGAQDDLPWVTAVADYVATMPRKERFVMGTMLYAMDWARERRPGEPALVWEHRDVEALARRVGATPVLDARSDAWTFTYTAADGRVRDVWYPDATTIATRFRLARERGLGVGVWRLGLEDQRLWDDPTLVAPR